MKIVVSGGTGFIGEPLCNALLRRAEVLVLTRNPEKVSIGHGVEWHPPEPGPWQDEVRTADAVINLAGETIAEGRWTKAKKRRLVKSRVEVTRSIVDAFRTSSSHAHRLINASAIGYYGDRGDTVLDESASPGSGFLPDLALAWERAAREAEDVANVTVLRFGVVVGEGGGALSAMLPIFRLGLGGRLGSGQQWMSWIDRRDLVRLLEWILDEPDRQGAYNATAPNPVRNDEFVRLLGGVLKRPTIVPAPVFALRFALGEMADEMLLASQRVVPKRALDEGFQFDRPGLEDAFRSALS